MSTTSQPAATGIANLLSETGTRRPAWSWTSVLQTNWSEEYRRSIASPDGYLEPWSSRGRILAETRTDD